MVAPAPSASSWLAGPLTQGRSASRIESDCRGAIAVLPENDVFHHLARRRSDHAVAASRIGRRRAHRRDSHRARRRFSGQTRDGRYSWARYYHPGLQRFISEDPLSVLMSGDANLYSYVRENPLTFVDPLGLYWQYSQSTGNLVYVDRLTGQITPVTVGYSGYGVGLNNPQTQQTPNIGPIPQGTWTIQQQQNNVTQTGVRLPGSMRLTPWAGTNTFGRSGFLIHGGDFTTRSSSAGCIVLPPHIRNRIANSGDDELRVIP